MRINRTNREINQLLRTPQQADTSNLSYIVEGLKHDIDEYFTRAPLKLVMELARRRARRCRRRERFTVHANSSCRTRPSQMSRRPTWPTPSITWPRPGGRFEHIFRPMNSEPARRVLNRVEEGINAIADACRSTISSSIAAGSASTAYALLAAADNINRDTQIWVDRDQNAPDAAADEDSEVPGPLPALQRLRSPATRRSTSSARESWTFTSTTNGSTPTFRSAKAGNVRAWARMPIVPRTPWSNCGRCWRFESTPRESS